MTARINTTRDRCANAERRARRETAQSDATRRQCVKIAFRNWGRSTALVEAAHKGYRQAAAQLLVNQVEAEIAAEAKAKKEN